MSQIAYRANLSASFIPLLTRHHGRSIIVPGPDQTFNRSVVSREDPDRDVGIPQAFYAHNVVPTSFGFQSVGYSELYPAVGTPETFSRIYLLRDSSENRVYFARTAAGHNYVIKEGEVAWRRINDDGSSGNITTAHVNGQTYLFFANHGCYVWDAATNTIVPITFTGLTSTDLLGVVSNNGYLVTYDELSIYWSASLFAVPFDDPVDFVPSEITGAGSASVEGVEGAIVVCLRSPYGFNIYTTANAVAAIFSNNADFPYNFRAIPGAGGVASSEDVTYDANAVRQFSYTTSGLQSLGANIAETVYAEITDFVGGKIFEDFDGSTGAFTETELAVPMQHKVVLVSDRYLVFSYGVTSLTHAILVDMVERRWGKLKIAHVDCFEHLNLANSALETPKKALAFLQADGTIKATLLDATEQSADSVLFLGKYQYARSRMLALDTVELEGASGETFRVHNHYTLDGDNAIREQLTEIYRSGRLRKYGTDRVAKNHSLCIQGNFGLKSVVLNFHVHGRD